MTRQAMIRKRKGVKGLFDDRCFDRGIIVLCVRWYLPYKLGLPNKLARIAWTIFTSHDRERLFAAVTGAVASRAVSIGQRWAVF
ncbi:hypothetical protein GXB81_06360 [Paraburkholderia sp. Ac-20336]|nr:MULTISPECIES: hypothetical protein [unclassified Paraburkholderia]MBN3802679.1 hypothetical protein [Paraburkholderia sp. Ac-20336]MBN3846695.1 hypothetical protein [Paraburkholderia sp. Ac-20342]NIF51879.1 hypothetical protein [Burkholderia sp. Ax-1724]NIF78461.1 hypothetical protein [Paraburkholderia sp. Cy-641]